MSFLFGSFASSSSSSGYYVPQRELTPLGLKIATFFDELFGVLGSILYVMWLTFMVLFTGNGVLKASKLDHLSYRDFTLATLVGSPILCCAYEIPMRIYDNLPERKKLQWTISVEAPFLFRWIFYPAINGCLCGMLGVVILRTNDHYAELLSKMTFLYIAEAAAIGGGVLWASIVFLIWWTDHGRRVFDTDYYGLYINRRESPTTLPDTQSELPRNSDSTIIAQC